MATGQAQAGEEAAAWRRGGPWAGWGLLGCDGERFWLEVAASPSGEWCEQLHIQPAGGSEGHTRAVDWLDGDEHVHGAGCFEAAALRVVRRTPITCGVGAAAARGDAAPCEE